MTRVKVKGTGCKAAHSPETEPNFYKMKPIFSFPMLQYHLLGAPLAHAGVNFHHSNIKAFSIPIPSLLNSGVSTSISCKGNEMNKVNEKPEVWNTQTPGCITSSKQNVPDNCAQQRADENIPHDAEQNEQMSKDEVVVESSEEINEHPFDNFFSSECTSSDLPSVCSDLTYLDSEEETNLCLGGVDESLMKIAFGYA
eukprot:CAMPEP_0113327540 /NCGR_PEP_ID=MMETSP0010_2-20120614/19361_1 /TAXON_ID=216773 ORGANISM="Corethron hystrix, Strain 308" /NCGR_SAMPLE_ID=MMETSP0010_2 /ASSEMBLY_ACC=CAM_ASM_000155 /LENGTH=196 /DNA_ID=CAMNT_0000188449 /DNA_START=13 /DNA_END=603 /DNA_ORIENTATION=+ /assembly_acc=CAM_ASM_000155